MVMSYVWPCGTSQIAHALLRRLTEQSLMVVASEVHKKQVAHASSMRPNAVRSIRPQTSLRPGHLASQAIKVRVRQALRVAGSPEPALVLGG
jgi:hypothetical protein